jgi:peptide/nickel transport system permease protein
LTQYVLRRLALMLPVAFLVSIGVFMLIHLSGGDPAVAILGEERSPEKIARVHEAYGLDDPLPVQYVHWLGRLLHGDMGRSIRTDQPVSQAVVERLPATLELGFAALSWSLLLAIPLGTVAALRRGSAADVLASGFTITGVSVPNFVIALLLILVVSIYARLLPPGGFVALFEDPVQNVSRLILPAITLGTAAAAINMRFTRSSMIEVLRQDYIRTARAKGANWIRVITGHALKNALIPVVTIVGLQIGAIIEGAVVTETIFSWPGVGKLIIDGIFNHDFPVIQGVVLVAAFSFMFANLLVDLAYAWLDPRITYA